MGKTSQGNTRTLISLNGIFALFILLAIVLWGYRWATAQEQQGLNHLQAATHGDLYVQENPDIIVGMPHEKSDDVITLSNASYTVFDQAKYESYALAGVNWQEGYVAPAVMARQQEAGLELATATEQEATEQESLSPKESAPKESIASESPKEAIASGNDANGKKVFNKCKACHQTKKGAKHRTGPTLWGIYDAPAASTDFSKYSNDLKEWGGIWTAENLDTFLKKPKGMFKKTRMAFAGLKNKQDRADVIAYLAALTD